MSASPATDLKKLAVVCTSYRPVSHTDVIVCRWITPRPADRDWQWDGPRTKLASLFADQYEHHDMARENCPKYGIELCETIDQALTLGTDQLAVDGVLLIGEHGEYPNNELGQKMYPRKRLFDGIVETFRRCGQTAPVFCDKFFAWDFNDAQEMMGTARELGFTLFGGSSIPLCDNVPPITKIDRQKPTEVVATYHGGDEPYGYHSIEFAQSLIERRPGGETGIESIIALRGQEVWDAMDRGMWSQSLMEASINADPKPTPGNYRTITADSKNGPSAIVLNYRDGLRVTHVNVDGAISGWSLAIQFADDPTLQACTLRLGDADNFYAHFATLSRMIEDVVITGELWFPSERVLLSTGTIDLAMKAWCQPGKLLQTPELAIAYTPGAVTAHTQTD